MPSLPFPLPLLLLIAIFTAQSLASSSAPFDYCDALSKSLLFFEAQRSGKLPSTQRVTWRGDSALKDGMPEGIDLVGGYYDAGDHVKFGFPMAFTVTMMSWGVVEYGEQMAACGQLSFALEAIKWGTDYFIKAHPEPNVLWGEVGDGETDHACWQRAEDMSTSRQAYKIDAKNPGSDLAGETAAALAASSIVFKSTDAGYSQILLQHAKELFKFADTFRGKYDNTIRVAKSYYESGVSGYDDELLWAAMWLYEATGDEIYLTYVVSNANSLGGEGWAMKEFSWDVKFVGVQTLAAKILLQGRAGNQAAALKQYQSAAEGYLCFLLGQNSQGNNALRTPGGLLFTRPWNNMQYVSSASFVLCVYADYLSAAGQQLHCPRGSLNPSELLGLARSQVSYILGKNPKGMSYLVGYGNTSPQHVHHRGASIISYEQNPAFVSCLGGYTDWYDRSSANPNVILGALVGGPGANDNYADDRTAYVQSEPATCSNAPLVGIFARLHGSDSYKNNQHHLPATPPPPTTSPVPHLPHNKPVPHIRPPLRPSPRKGNAPPHDGHSQGIIVKQRVTSSWSHGGRLYRRYAVRVTNVSGGPVTQLKLTIKGLSGPVWGLNKVGNSGEVYTFPPWLQIFGPRGGNADFIYIQVGPPAVILVSSFTSTH